MAMNQREIEELSADVMRCSRITPQEQRMIKAALELAYQVGVRDGYKEAGDDFGKLGH